MTSKCPRGKEEKNEGGKKNEKESGGLKSANIDSGWILLVDQRTTSQCCVDAKPENSLNIGKLIN